MMMILTREPLEWMQLGCFIVKKYSTYFVEVMRRFDDGKVDSLIGMNWLSL